jgi:hypothetical protein
LLVGRHIGVVEFRCSLMVVGIVVEACGPIADMAVSIAPACIAKRLALVGGWVALWAAAWVTYVVHPHGRAGI